MHPRETLAWRRCFIGGVAALALGLGGEFGFAEPVAASDASPVSASFVARALEHVTPDLELVRVGSWLGKRVLGQRPQKAQSQCG